MDNNENRNSEAREKENKDFSSSWVEYFRDRRSKNEGIGSLFNMFFHSADQDFINNFEEKMSKWVIAGKELSDLVKKSESDTSLRSELRQGFLDIAAKQKAVSSKRTEED